MNKEIYESLHKIYTDEKWDVTKDVQERRKNLNDFKADVEETLAEYFPEVENSDEYVKRLADVLFGYGLISSLIEDEDITDIKILSYNHIRVKKRGKRYTSDVKFKSEDDYNRFIHIVGTKNKVNTSTVNALQKFTDNTSNDKYILRFTLATSFITSDQKFKLAIRKEPRDFYSMDDLSDKTVLKTEEPMFPKEIKDLIIERWKTGSVLICGAMSAGKTYLLNALKEETPEDEAQVVIQEADELSNKTHPDTIFFHSVGGTKESETKYDLGRLSVGALTFDVERIIVGEIKGVEAMYFLNASYTGSICGGTIHSNCAREGIDKIVDYALEGHKYTKRELMKMMTSLKTVIYCKKFKVEEIVSVEGYDSKNEEIIYKTIYARNK